MVWVLESFKVFCYRYRPLCQLGWNTKFVSATGNVFRADVIRELIDRITIFKTESVNRRIIQRIRIIYNCIGEINNTELDEKTA